ncbi:hypothetical protein JTM44_06870 [Pseudomonas aeruginosa]|nr:hypothetical protein [Pseudomonas aeruginosa]MBN0497032.1 hypothetical protein [Pseudomonas aeruginosa]MBN0607334.1 hypothetical protein [Pseudomonas aeruginosa]MBN0621082.1 hypothetical protein [Pseudomonas aeruginosa]MBN0931411.1 hypothetical protein [Pseudomonas aeruginosa]
MSNELTDVRCPCGAEFQADSYDAGFIAGSGMCQNCDAALPPKDICTCPSGDGSLSHPCPAHPAVEQAGGDRWDALQSIMEWTAAENIPDDRKLCLIRNAARAALAQPSGEVVVTKNESGAIVSVTRQDKEGRVLSVIAESATLTAQAEQAEAERPEVVAWQYRVTAGPQTGWSLWHPGKGEEFERSYTVERRPLMTVAQHERIVGELRAVIAQLRQHKNDYMDSGQETYRALQNEIREREAEIARLDGLVSGRTAERDAALARVAELEKQERPEGPTEDELEAAGLGYPLHKEEAVKLWYSGFRSEVITVLEAWEAIGHDIGMNPDKGELLDSLRYMLEKCEAHDAALARVAELERQQPVAWMHDQPNRVDVIHRDVKDLLQRVPGSSRGIHRPLDVSEHYTIPLYAAPVAQAQHSVPEGWKLVPVEPTEDVLEAIHNGGYVGDDQELRWFYQSILAAAPAPGGE